MSGGRLFAVVHADLDNFKSFNDHYGFMRGDAVIKFTAQVMLQASTECGDPNAFVGHVGGDLGKFDAEGAAKAATLHISGQLAKLEAADILEQCTGLIPDAEAAQGVTGVVKRDRSSVAGAEIDLA